MNRGDWKVDWYDEEMIRKIISESVSQSDALRKMGLILASNAVTLRKYIAK